MLVHQRVTDKLPEGIRVYTSDFPQLRWSNSLVHFLGHERVTRKVPSCQDLSSHAAQMIDVRGKKTWSPHYVIETIGIYGKYMGNIWEIYGIYIYIIYIYGKLIQNGKNLQ